MKTTEAGKPGYSDYDIDFQLRQEVQGRIVQIRDKLLNHLLFIIDGEMNISYNEFKNHLCRAGEMVFIPQDALTRIEAFTDIKYLSMSFNNHIAIYDEVELHELREFEQERAIFHKLDIRTPLTEVIESIVFYQEHKISNTPLNEVKEKEIFLVLKVFYAKQELARFLKPLINPDADFKTLVINSYQGSRNVEELAKRCNLSVRVFTRKFKSQFNDSPYRWILRQRGKQIKALLADKRIPMQTIVNDFGFSSPAHFTTYCKKQFGATPSAFRNALNGRIEPIKKEAPRLNDEL
ncbi:MAG: helix-turn-helix transcriptional regulator [Tannerellaceae bacterium]|nr:helix-turn-helix transcriptional regulator [Tannerellaceae bacterium]